MPFELGQSAEVTRRFSASDVAGYIALGGHEPRHCELPEPMIDSMFSYLLGVKLPGIGTNYLKQDTRYLVPAEVDEALTARIVITAVRPEKRLVDFETTCQNASGKLVCRGRALVYVADVEE